MSDKLKEARNYLTNAITGSAPWSVVVDAIERLIEAKIAELEKRVPPSDTSKSLGD